MSDEIKRDEDLMDELLQDPVTKQLTPSNQVLFLPSGGRALTRTRGALRAGQMDEAAIEAIEEERRQFLASDPVVQTASAKDPIALLSALKVEVARETASLAYQRMRNERQGKDGTALSSRRIDALKKIADIELEMRKLNVEQIDVYGEKIQKIFKLWIEIIQNAASITLNQEQSNLFFNKLTTEMSGWEEKAEDLIR